MSIYICTICHQQKDGDFNCGFIKGREDEEICEECSEESEVKLFGEVANKLHLMIDWDKQRIQSQQAFEVLQESYPRIINECRLLENKEVVE